MIKINSSFLICFSVLVFILIESGCNSGSKSDLKADPTASSIANVKSRKDLSGFKVGYCTPSLNAPFYAALSQALQKYTESFGMKFTSIDGQDDIAKQISAVEDLAARGVNILILNPLDHKALVPVTNSVIKSGIPVFIVDSFIDQEADYITSVQANNLGNGEMLGEWIVKKMGSKPMKAVLISGAQGNPIGKEKRQGLIRGITEQQLRSQGKVNLEIVAQGWGNWSNTGGLKAMEDILVAHPDINVLLAENDAMAMGAMKAVSEAGKSGNILIVGFDGQKEAYQFIQSGNMGVTAINSPDELAKLTIESVVRYLNGEKSISKIIYTEAIAVDINNVNIYYNPNAIF